MRAGILVSLGVSAALGLGALAVAHLWAPEAPLNSAPSDRKNAVPVVVAASALSYGQRLEAKHLTLVQIPAGAEPQGSYRSVQQVLNQPGGAPVVLAPLGIREPLLPAKLSGSGARPSLAAAIDEDKRGYTIRVTDVSGVGGHALPGDRVDVMLTRDLSTDSQNRRLISAVVIQNVRVLGIDLNADPSSTKAVTPKTTTLEVSVEEAQKLAVAAELGALSLALRRSGAVQVATVRPISARDIDSQVEVSPPTMARTPNRQTRQYPAKGPANSANTGSLVIVHGSTATRVSAPAERPSAGT